MEAESGQEILGNMEDFIMEKKDDGSIFLHKKRKIESTEQDQTGSVDESNSGQSNQSSKKVKEVESTETSAVQSMKTPFAEVYEVARNTVKNVINEANPKTKAVLETGKISWNKWTRDVKKSLVDRLYIECSMKGLNPQLKHAQAVREVLAEKYPDLFGYGILFDTKHHETAYEVNAEKLVEQEAWRDNLFWSMYHRITQHATTIKVEEPSEASKLTNKEAIQVARDGTILDSFGLVIVHRAVNEAEKAGFDELKNLYERMRPDFYTFVVQENLDINFMF